MTTVSRPVEQTPNNKLITMNCFLNREGRIVCKVESTQDWRSNLNEAIEIRNNLRKQTNTIDRVIKKLKESKDRSIYKPGYIPCKCLPEKTYKMEVEERRSKYRDGRTISVYERRFCKHVYKRF